MIKTLNITSSSSLTLSETDLDLQATTDVFPEPAVGEKKQLRRKAILSLVILACLVFLIAMVSAMRVVQKSQEEQILAPVVAPVQTNTQAPVVLLAKSPSKPPVTPKAPTMAPIAMTLPQETTAPTRIAFDPGNLIKDPHGLLLSVGLQARIIAQSGRRVPYQENQTSSIPFHASPDLGATFVDPRPENSGGWIYVSNSEVRRPWYNGGVGALTFNAQGHSTDYRMILTNTTANCGGGVTPWNSWVSGEEYREGRFWQVDPTGTRPPELLTVGTEGGMYESFAADPARNQYFVTEDFENGPVRRFVPSSTPNPVDPWNILHGEGETTYLRLSPTSDKNGTYEWISDKRSAQSNAQALFPNCEGIDVHGDALYFISKTIETVFVLDLKGSTYTSYSTRQGLFQGQPDQMVPLKNHDDTENTMYFFTEDGSASAGVHARTSDGQVWTIVEGPTYSNEVTGLAFSPDHTRMYFAFQVDGVVFEVVRQDGLPFTARSLNLRYHSSALDSVQ